MDICGREYNAYLASRRELPRIASIAAIGIDTAEYSIPIHEWFQLVMRILLLLLSCLLVLSLVFVDRVLFMPPSGGTSRYLEL